EAELTATLTAAAQERFRVLEVVARDLPGEHTLVRDRRAVSRHDERDFTGFDDGHRHVDNAIAPAPVSEVPARRQHARLVARLAVAGDDAARRQRGAELLDDEP